MSISKNDQPLRTLVPDLLPQKFTAFPERQRLFLKLLIRSPEMYCLPEKAAGCRKCEEKPAPSSPRTYNRRGRRTLSLRRVWTFKSRSFAENCMVTSFTAFWFSCPRRKLTIEVWRREALERPKTGNEFLLWKVERWSKTRHGDAWLPSSIQSRCISYRR